MMNRPISFLLFLLFLCAEGDPIKGKYKRRALEPLKGRGKRRALKQKPRSNSRYAIYQTYYQEMQESEDEQPEELDEQPEELGAQEQPPPPPPPPVLLTMPPSSRSVGKGKSGKGKSTSKSKSKSGKGRSTSTDHSPTQPPGPPGPGPGNGFEVTLKITNLTYLQPFSQFIVVLHNRDADPLFVFGEEASVELAALAEDGNPGPLFQKYHGAFGVKYVEVYEKDAPFFGGEVVYITVPYERDYPYLTMGSMAINTNDCFVALNGVYLSPGQVIDVPGYDAGTEVNNELCSSIPGPACPSGSGNVRSGNGEGYVHIHRGFKGVGDRLSEAGYDWRNPMMRVEVHM